jgi:SAM-dependent methyltransferase
MDALTIKYYNENAESIFAMYTSLKGGGEKYWKLAFPPGSEILDIGSGSGRDVNLLIERQYEAYGVEPSCNLRALSLLKMPKLQGRISSGALPNLVAQMGRKFDGILCSAIFQHIPPDQQFDAAVDIKNLLKPDGRLLLSFPKDRPGLDTTGREENGRLYTKLIPEEVILLFERLGFRCIGNWDDEDGFDRPGFTWKTLLFSLSGCGAIKSSPPQLPRD